MYYRSLWCIVWRGELRYVTFYWTGVLGFREFFDLEEGGFLRNGWLIKIIRMLFLMVVKVLGL